MDTLSRPHSCERMCQVRRNKESRRAHHVWRLKRMQHGRQHFVLMCIFPSSARLVLNVVAKLLLCKLLTHVPPLPGEVIAGSMLHILQALPRFLANSEMVQLAPSIIEVGTITRRLVFGTSFLNKEARAACDGTVVVVAARVDHVPIIGPNFQE